MVKEVNIKTTKSSNSVSAYLNAIEPASARKDAKLLAELFKETTGAKPKMWGSSIVGYGQYTYYRANGDVGVMCASGFSIRKSGPVLYIMPGYKNYASLLEKIGPHKLGKSCLYLKYLKDINMSVVAKLIKAGIKDLKQSQEVII